MSKSTIANRLPQDKCQEIEKRAAAAKITDKGEVSAIGANQLAQLQVIVSEVDGQKIMDMGVFGECFKDLKETMGQLKPEDALKAQPNWADTLAGKHRWLRWLREQYGAFAAYTYRFKTIGAAVEEKEKLLTVPLRDLFTAAAMKGAYLESYFKLMIDILGEAYFAELMSEAEKEMAAALQRIKKRDFQQDKDLNLHKDLGMLLLQQAQHLDAIAAEMESEFEKGQVFNTAQYSSAQKIQMQASFNAIMWRRCGRVIIDSLQMAELLAEGDKQAAFTEALMMTTSDLEKAVSGKGLAAGNKPILGIALMKKLADDAIAMFNEKEAAIKQINTSFLQFDAEIAQIHANIRQTIATKNEVQATE